MVKIVKIAKIVKIVKMLVRSCFLITVIKYLKGHWSLGSLFNVNKQKVGHSLTQWQGHLLSCQVTAKNIEKKVLRESSQRRFDIVLLLLMSSVPHPIRIMEIFAISKPLQRRGRKYVLFNS